MNKIIEKLKDNFKKTLEEFALKEEEKEKIFNSFSSTVEKICQNVHLVLDDIYDGVVVVDENNVIIDVNEVFLKWISKKREDVVGRNFYEFLHKGKFFYLKIEDKMIPVSIKKQEFEVFGKKFKRFILMNIKERVFFEQKLKNILRLYKALTHINELLIRAIDKYKVFNDACEIIVKEGHFDFAWIGEINGNKIKPVAYYGNNEEFKEYLKNQEFLMEKFFFEKVKSDKFFLENDLKNEESIFQHKISIPIFKEENAVSAVVLNEEIVAILCVYYKGKIFEKEEIDLLKQIAHDIGFGIVALNRKEDIDYFTYYDVLTRLPNRRYFFEHLENKLKIDQSKDKRGALVIVDINNFNVINSTVGFWGGDYVLIEVSKALKEVIDEKDLLSRIGSDEFGIYFDNVSSLNEVISRLKTKLNNFEFVFFIDGKKFLVSLSVGIALFPEDATDKESLFSAAEAAMKVAKTKREHLVVYSKEMKKTSLEILKRESELVEAIKKDEFELFYQPIVSLENKNVEMAEALLRWKKDGKYIPPLEFIPLIEKLGLIKEVGMMVMDKAFRFIKENDLKIKISINVSTKQIKSNFTNEVIELVKKYNIDPSLIIFEITESVFMENMNLVIEHINRLNEYGIKFEIDDFGTGYSSLAYLKKLPIISLKIDRMFIKDLPQNEEDASITRAIISMSHSLGKKVIAEGVETKEQLEFLINQDCDYIQGFYFSKPLPSSEFLEYLKNFNFDF